MPGSSRELTASLGKWRYRSKCFILLKTRLFVHSAEGMERIVMVICDRPRKAGNDWLIAYGQAQNDWIPLLWVKETIACAPLCTDKHSATHWTQGCMGLGSLIEVEIGASSF